MDCLNKKIILQGLSNYEMNSFSVVNLDMVKKKGLTIPCYVCYTFIHLGFHIFLNAHSELQSEMCQKENTLVDKPFALPYSSALRNIQVVPVAEIGLEFRARTKRLFKSMSIQDFKYLEICSQEFQWRTTARAHS